MTDEDILHELLVISAYNEKQKEENPEDKSEIFKSDEEQYDDLAKRLEEGEDIDFDDLTPTPPDRWEKI